MNPGEIINEYSRVGVMLSLNNDGALTIRGDKEATMRMLPKIRAHKPELLALLTANRIDVEALAGDLAAELSVKAADCLNLLDDDKRLIVAGDKDMLAAWRCAIETRLRQGLWPPFDVLPDTAETRQTDGKANNDALRAAVFAKTSTGRVAVELEMQATPEQVAAAGFAVVRFKLRGGEGGGTVIGHDGPQDLTQTLERMYGDRLESTEIVKGHG